MGIFERPKGSDTWWVRFMGADGKEHRQKAGAKSTANKLYLKRREEARIAKLFPEEQPREVMLTKDLLTHYQATTQNDLCYAKYWTEYLGLKPIEAVTAKHVENWRASRLALGKAPATVNRAVAFLKRRFNLALRDGKIARNPVLGVKQLRENNCRIRYLLDTEEELIEAKALPRHWEWIQFAYLTGLRQGEQVRMRREHINFTQKTLVIPITKNGEQRHVPLGARAIEILRAQLARHDCPWVWPDRYGKGHLHPQTFIHALKRALDEAKVINFRWHDLRHTFCSRLVMAGVSLRAVQLLAGHKTISVTERYAHLSPGHLLDAVELISPPLKSGAAPGAGKES